MQTRRDMMKHSALVAGLLAAALPLSAQAQAAFNRAAFDAKSMDEMLKALGLGKPTESKEVTLTGPDIAENGAVVPLGVASTAAGVKRLLLLVEKNPNILAASFDVSDAVEASMSTRVKMGQTSNVFAVAITGDNKVLFAQKEVKVTLGGCGG
ncbi:thiosulfate oxidation carrier protein SoxY [Paucibacter sp. PLA-PC-4]|uniref:thiosulfate oxidation carrier protein SoxY n=1 Tax=Paucibacter sp. PLA-PC-4 TaxID=2993655 RepID=UPI00224901CF|nr:thiosulfate oxidation carrier protein SoxY [Paucibacter sp. PLA-PC-4]MCX2862177.1 thiosulfate oxidation carrier protein SoxY [Paucibacter sp. PLA-PC-4]